MVAKSGEAILAESDRLHDLAVKFKKQGDKVSADALNIKVTAMRKRAISKMGRRPKFGNKRVDVIKARANSAVVIN